VSCGPKLTTEEQSNTLVALRYLRGRVGTWDLLAKALGFARQHAERAEGAQEPIDSYRLSRVQAGRGTVRQRDVREVPGHWDVPALRTSDRECLADPSRRGAKH